MALQKQVLAVSLGQGIDTKTDPSSVVAGKLLVLENGTFINPQSIHKRNGFAALSSTILNPPVVTSPTMSSAQALMGFKDELLGFDISKYYSYSSANNGWAYKGTALSATVTQDQVLRNTSTQVQQDSARHPSGFRCFAWEDSRGGVRYSVIDETTGQSVVADRRVSLNEIKPRVLAIGTGFVLLWANSSDARLYASYIPIANPTAPLVIVAITAASGARQLNSVNPNYDAVVIDSGAGEKLFIAYNDSTPSTGGIAGLRSYAADPLTFGPALPLIAEVGGSIAVFADHYRLGPVVAWYNGTAVRLAAYDSLFTTTFADIKIETLASVVSITGVSLSSTAVSFDVFYSVSAGSTYNYLTRVARVTEFNSGASVGTMTFPFPLFTSPGYASATPASLVRSAALFGRAFAYNAASYVPLVFQSPLQSTYFLSDGNGRLLTKSLYGLAGGIPARTDGYGTAMLTSTNPLDDGSTWQLACLVKDLLTTIPSSGGGTSVEIYTQTGVQSLSINLFDTTNSYLRAELGNNLHLSGGFIQAYDGANLVEHGFHLFPEPVTVPGPVAGHTYQYVVCYEWTDGQGQIHRSSPSPAVSLVQANPISGANAVTVTIPTLRLTSKTAVTCVVYRTADLGTVFYRVSSATAPTGNSTSADTVTFSDTVTDAVLIGLPEVYTTGNVLENIEPNSVTAMVVHRNRLMVLDSGTGQWFYSKEWSQGGPVEFSDSFVLTVDPRGGKSTAGASLDDKFIIFKPDSMFAVTGRGPDDTGNQNDFSDPVRINSDCGCTNPRSIVTVPGGVMYRSKKGIYLLDRSLGVTYIGAPVEAYNDDVITSSQLIADTNQVRFTLQDGGVLVYDYLMQQWSVFTNITAVDSHLFDDKFTFATATGQVHQETPGVFTDNGDWIPLKMKTSWLQLAGVQGFQRVYRALFLGTYATPHSVRVQVAYDLSPGLVQDHLIDSGTVSNYGDDTVYGGDPLVDTDTNVYGGSFVTEQYQINLTRQKCEAVQFVIEDVRREEAGEGMSFSSLTLVVGIKKGAFRPGFQNLVGGN